MGARAIRRNPGARRPAWSCARSVALAALFLALPLAAPAAEFQVTNLNNSGSGSLRQAILDLNDLGAVADEQHRIVFDDALADDSTITLLTPLEAIAVDVDIDASDVSGLSLVGPVDPPGTIFLRTNTTRVTLIDLASQEGTIEIGSRDELGFDTSDGPDDVDVLVSSNIMNDANANGKLVKDGLGTLELSGSTSYTGGTLVNAGTLIMSGLPPPFGSIDIEESGTLVFDLAAPLAPFTLSGPLNGSGTLVKRNADPLADVTLLGGGVFTGLTRVEGGTLIDASGVIQGDIVLDDTLDPLVNFVFDVDEDQTRTHSGNISGSGDLTKWGAGSLTLLGSNTYDGDTYLDEGTLIGSSASLPGDIVASAFDDSTGLFLDTTLIFDQSSAGSFDGDIWDNGDATNGLSLEKRGAGTLTLSGDVTAFRGTTLSQGRLIVDGFLTTPSIAVGAGTVLGGDGVVAGDVLVEGTVSPGPVSPSGTSQVGSLDVDSVTFQPGTVFEVDISDTAAPSYGDSLDVMGSASLGSENTLRVVPASGTYATPVSQRILSADSLTGSFTFETDFFRLDVWCGDATPVLTGTCASLDGETLDLWIVSNNLPWSSAATTPNQLTVGQVLDAEEPGATGDLADVFDALQTIPVEQVQPLLDAIGGEPLSAFPTAQLAIGERFNRALHRRVRDAVWGEPEALYDPWATAPAPKPSANRRSAASPVAVLAAPNGRRAQTRGRRVYAGPLRTFEGDTGVGGWIDGWGSFGDLEGDGNSADVETQSFGATLGVDYRFGERFSAGLAGGYANADIELDGRASQGDVEIAQGALYAGYVDPRFHVTASGRYGHAWNDSERRIAFSGFDRKTKASFESQDVGARAEIGANALRLGPVDVLPLAAFDWAQLRRDDFAESGAGSLDLVVEDETFTSLLSSAGGSLRGFFDLGDDVAMVAELRGFWLHEFGDVERPIRARLSGAVASGSFEIVGAELPRNRILAGLGWSASIGDVVRVFADYDVALASGLLQHEVTLTVRMHF